MCKHPQKSNAISSLIALFFTQVATIFLSQILAFQVEFSTIQMVLLWRDPEGNSVKSATVHNSVPTQNHCSKEMQKISALEKNISEKDNMIAKLQDELKMLKEVSS